MTQNQRKQPLISFYFSILKWIPLLKRSSSFLLQAFVFFVFLSPQYLMAETEPEPEYPYPKKQKTTFEVERPQKIHPDGSYYYGPDESKKQQNNVDGVEAPYKIGPDGSYYYTDSVKAESSTVDGVEKPMKKQKDGSYLYDTKKKSSKRIYGEKPDKINADGSFVYDSKPKAVNNVLYLRGGFYGPPKIKSATSNQTYTDFYPNRSSFVFNVEYDWRLGSTFFLKLGTGLSSAQGKGKFTTSANAGLTPRESFQYFIVPTILSLAYKFQLWDVQYLTPYVDGGLGYFAFMESRSDGDKTSFGGASVLAMTGGLLISLAPFQSGSDLSNDYGANQTWLDIQYKQILGLHGRKDFSSNMITFGFAIGF